MAGANLGTAYITVVPTMKGVAATVSKQLTSAVSAATASSSKTLSSGMSKAAATAGKTSGQGYKTAFTASLTGLQTSVSKQLTAKFASAAGKTAGINYQQGFQSSLTNLTSSISSKFSSLKSRFGKTGSESGNSFSTGFVAKLGVLTGTTTALATSAISGLTGAISNAVSRVDTLNQYPKVLQNLGFSAEEAEASINDLSSGIQGLPTSLDSVAATAQSLAPLTSGLTEATDLTLALNNAFLASGASTDDASRGLQQYTQMLSVGKVDQDAWTTLTETMGVALNQVAQEMLGAEANSTDLYSALQSGAISFDEFNQAMIKMNEEGGAGYVSFATQAMDASAGIATAMENLQTAITRGFGEIFDAIGAENFMAIFGGFGSVIENLLGAVADFLSGAQPLITFFADLATNLGEATSFGDFVTTLIQGFASGIPMLIQTGTQLVSSLIQGITEALPEITSTLQSAIPNLVTSLTTILSTAVPQLVTLVAGLLTQLGQSLVDIIPTLTAQFPTIINAIISTIITLLPTIIQAGVTLFTSLISALPTIISTIAAALPLLLNGIVEALVVLLPTIIQAGITLFTALVNALPEIISVIVAVIPTIIDAIISAAITLIPLIIDAGVELLTALIDNLPTIISVIVAAIPTIISSIVAAVLSNLPAIISAGVQLIGSLAKNSAQIIAAIVKAIPTIISGIKDGILSRDNLDKIISAGEDLISGLWEGISNVKDWLLGKINGWVDSVIGGIKGFFGIGSPSKVMRDEIGKWLPEGMAVGISANASAVGKALDDIGSDVATMSLPAPELVVTPTLGGLDVRRVNGLQAGLQGLSSGDTYNVYLDGDLLNVDSRVERALSQLVAGVQATRRMGVA